ncbi:hypothetical protein F5X98DRAFT_390872 [Xylaria grammica]|nr:hypothetical protein F5X98DRAFT_390872 [Xylaria grammica]
MASIIEDLEAGDIELEEIDLGNASSEQASELLALPPAPQPPWIVQPATERSLWKLVQNFDFGWYVWPTGAGIMSILVGALSDWVPSHKEEITKVSLSYLVLQITSFLGVLGITIVRYCKWPRLWLVTLKHPGQTAQVALTPMALSTMIITFNRIVGGGQPVYITDLWIVYNSPTQDVGCFLPYTSIIIAMAAGSDISVNLVGVRLLMVGMVELIVLSFAMLLLGWVIIRDAYRLIGKRDIPGNHITDAFISLTALAYWGLAAQQIGEQASRYYSRGFKIASFSSAIVAWSGCSIYSIVLLFHHMSNGWSTFPFNNLSWWIPQFSIGAFALLSWNLGSSENLGYGANIFNVIGLILGTCSVMISHYNFFALWKLIKRNGLDGLLDAPELREGCNQQLFGAQTLPWYKRWLSSVSHHAKPAETSQDSVYYSVQACSSLSNPSNTNQVDHGTTKAPSA